MQKQPIDKKIILVVEDERPLSRAITSKLELNGFAVITAVSVHEALLQIKTNSSIAAVWLDHYLIGKEDGLDLVAKLKSNAAWGKLPVYVVSNTASQEKVRAYIKFGVERFYVKSDLRLDEIIAEIKATVGIGQ